MHIPNSLKDVLQINLPSDLLIRTLLDGKNIISRNSIYSLVTLMSGDQNSEIINNK